jgi:hypothetical protein
MNSLISLRRALVVALLLSATAAWATPPPPNTAASKRPENARPNWLALCSQDGDLEIKVDKNDIRAIYEATHEGCMIRLTYVTKSPGRTRLAHSAKCPDRNAKRYQIIACLLHRMDQDGIDLRKARTLSWGRVSPHGQEITYEGEALAYSVAQDKRWDRKRGRLKPPKGKSYGGFGNKLVLEHLEKSKVFWALSLVLARHGLDIRPQGIEKVFFRVAAKLPNFSALKRFKVRKGDKLPVDGALTFKLISIKQSR